MDGIGAFCNGVPPVEVVYHFKVAPSKGVAVSAIAESPWQYMFDAIFEISTAAGLITTAKVCAAPIHPFEDGNGRIHRYLMHHVLARKKYVPMDMS